MESMHKCSSFTTLSAADVSLVAADTSGASSPAAMTAARSPYSATESYSDYTDESGLGLLARYATSEVKIMCTSVAAATSAALKSKKRKKRPDGTHIHYTVHICIDHPVLLLGTKGNTKTDSPTMGDPTLCNPDYLEATVASVMHFKLRCTKFIGCRMSTLHDRVDLCSSQVLLLYEMG